MERNNRIVGILNLILTFFMWGSVYVAGKLGSARMSPFLLAPLRCAIAAPMLLFLARNHLRRKIDRSDWKYFAVTGVLGYYATIVLVQLGIHLTGASTAALVNSLNPVVIMLFAALWLREKITPIKLLCLALAMAGTLIVAGDASGSRELAGIFATLLATAAWGMAAVCVKKLTAKYPAILVTAYGMTLSLILHIPTGIIAALIQPPEVDFGGVLTVLYLGLVGSGLSQITWAVALSQFPAGTCSLFYPLQPVFSAILASVILKERFSPAFFIGLAFVAADVALSAWAAAHTPKAGDA